MANQEQLEILKQGVEVWNEWRLEHRSEEIDLYEADLQGTHLKGVLLTMAYLQGIKLQKATLTGAILFGADLTEADLTEADLTGAELTGADLIQTNLSQAIITGVHLYGTARDNWIIDGITCDYLYWDEYSKERTPKDRNFRSGEFEERYKQLPTFEYAFEHGIALIDIGIINQIVNGITALHPEWELKLDSFHSRGQPHANFTIRENDLIVQAFQQIKTHYEATLNRLKGQYEASNRILATVIRELTDKPQIMLTGDIVIGDKHIGRDNIEISGQAHVNHLTTGDSVNESTESAD